MACIISTFCILLSAVWDGAALGNPVVDFVVGIAMANVFQLVALLFPPSRLALTSFSNRLEALEGLQVSLLLAFKEAFSMKEDVHVSIVEHLLGEMRSMITSLKADLPSLYVECIILLGSMKAYESAVAYLKEIDEQMEFLQGMRLSLAKMLPSKTHQLYLQFLQWPIEQLADQCVSVIQVASRSVNAEFGCCSSDRQRTKRQARGMIDAAIYDQPSIVARELQLYVVRARAAIVYSAGACDLLAVQIRRRMSEEQQEEDTHDSIDVSEHTSPPPSLAPAATDSILDQSAPPPIPTWRRGSDTTFLVFMKDYDRVGYQLLLPRNSFILSFILYAQALKRLERCRDIPSISLPSLIWKSFVRYDARSIGSSVLDKFRWMMDPAKLRQPLKIGLAIATSSMFVLSDHAKARLGPTTIWSTIAISQTLSPYPSSSFRTGFNRIQGTVFGCMYAMITLDWFGAKDDVAVLISITVWVFLCNYCRMSPSYGETSAVAAITAPIIILGPGPVDTRAMQRIQQIILGTALYVLIDVSICPVRAKLLLRKDLASSIANFASLWQSTLSIFLHRDQHDTPEQVDKLWQDLKVALRREEAYIFLAAGEPELLHKPFQAAAYRDVVQELREVSRYMSLLWRSTVCFPSAMEAKDREVLTSIQHAVMKLEEPTRDALLDAQAAVATMTQCRHSDTKKRYPLLGLRAEFIALQEFVDDYMKHKMIENRSITDDYLVLTSPGFILNLNAMLFNLEAIGSGLLRLGHATRKLVELEKANYYTLRKNQ